MCEIDEQGSETALKKNSRTVEGKGGRDEKSWEERSDSKVGGEEGRGGGAGGGDPTSADRAGEDMVDGIEDGAEGGKLVVTADPRNPDESTSVALDEVKSRKPYPVSLMPAGMINGLNKDEILNLVAYLQSGGDPKHPAFAK